MTPLRQSSDAPGQGDCVVCKLLVFTLILNKQVDGELLLAPGFTSPPNSDYVGYHQYIDDYLPEETPYLYGLHPNAEIGYLTTVSERLFKVST